MLIAKAKTDQQTKYNVTLDSPQNHIISVEVCGTGKITEGTNTNIEYQFGASSVTLHIELDNLCGMN